MVLNWVSTSLSGSGVKIVKNVTNELWMIRSVSLGIISEKEDSVVVSRLMDGPELNLVGWWRFEEGAGSNVLDSSGFGNDGTIETGSAYFIDDGVIDNYGTGYAGSPDMILIQNKTGKLAQSVFTVSGWYQGSDTSTETIIWKGVRDNKTDNSDNYHIAVTSNFRMNVERASDDADFTAVGSTTVTDSKWHFFTGTFDGRNVKMYVDGILDADKDSGSNWLPYMGGGKMAIGTNQISNHGTISYLVGSLDDIRVYDQSFVADEIRKDLFKCVVGSGVNYVNINFGDSEIPINKNSYIILSNTGGNSNVTFAYERRKE